MNFHKTPQIILDWFNFWKSLLTGKPMSRGFFYFLVFVSGWSALTYQICWERLFITSFGIDFYSVTAIVSAFIMGLGLGALVIGKYVDRFDNPLKLYGLIEIGIGIFGLISVKLIQSTYPLILYFQQTVSGPFPGFLLSFLFVLIIIFIPTFLMGGTLPVMVKHILKDFPELGSTLGRLYGLNTLGSMVGAFMGAFVTISLLNVDGSIYFAAILNLCIGVICYLKSKTAIQNNSSLTTSSTKKELGPPTPPNPKTNWIFASLIFLYFISSMVALGYEIFWYRLASLRWRNNTGSFGLVLGFYLMGVVAGNFIFSVFAQKLRQAGVRFFASLQFLTAFFAVAGFLLFRWTYNNAWVNPTRYLENIYTWIYSTPAQHALGDPLFLSTIKIALPFIFLITIPMFIQGMAFPLIVFLTTETMNETGKRVGLVYLVSIVGSFLGSLGVGYLLIPFFGLESTFWILLSISLMLGAFAWFMSVKKQREKMTNRFYSPATEVALALCALLFLAVKLQSGIYNYLLPTHLQTLKEGITGVTYINGRSGKTSTLGCNINGQNHGVIRPFKSTRDDIKISIAMNLHPNPKKALLIGLGNANTLVALEKYGEIKQIDVVEISRELIPALHQQEGIPWVHHALHSQKVNIVHDDGRAFLNKSRDRYDIIAMAPIFSFNSYGGYLYSKEMFELVKAHLGQNGVFIILNDSLVAQMRFIQMKTFASVFEYFFLDSGNYLHGSKDPFTLNLRRINASYKLNHQWFKNQKFQIESEKDHPKLEIMGDSLKWIRSDQNAFKDIESFPLNTDLEPRTEYFLFQFSKKSQEIEPPLSRKRVKIHIPTFDPSKLILNKTLHLSLTDLKITSSEAKDIQIQSLPHQGLGVRLTKLGWVNVSWNIPADFIDSENIFAGKKLIGVAVSGENNLKISLEGWDENEKNWKSLSDVKSELSAIIQERFIKLPAWSTDQKLRLDIQIDQPSQFTIHNVSLYELKD